VLVRAPPSSQSPPHYLMLVRILAKTLVGGLGHARPRAGSLRSINWRVQASLARAVETLAVERARPS
jgi:hypothetical protein